MSRKILMAFFVALAGLFVFASGVKADTIQKINVSADNKISSLLPTTVYKNPGNTYIEEEGGLKKVPDTNSDTDSYN